MRLEGVVLRRDLVVVEAAKERNLLQDIGLDARNAVEEEQGEDASGGTEGGADGTPVCTCVVREVVRGGLAPVWWFIVAYILMRALGVKRPSLSLGIS